MMEKKKSAMLRSLNVGSLERTDLSLDLVRELFDPRKVSERKFSIDDNV